MALSEPPPPPHCLGCHDSGDKAGRAVHQDTKFIFLWAWAALDGVTAAGNMLMLKADTSPQPFLLLSIFSKLLAVICV